MELAFLGKYKAEVFNPNTHTFEPSSSLVMSVAVEETFQNDHRVVNTRGSSEGRFTFSAADSGDHRICFTPAHAGTNGGWLANGMPVGGIKLSLDLATGETSQIESTDKGKLSDIVQRVKDLNARLHDIRREQVFQRVGLSFAGRRAGANGRGNVVYANDCASPQEREAEFRDQSETTNARVVRWTLLQLVVLGLTCAWQLTHLRSFFIKQKLT